MFDLASKLIILSTLEYSSPELDPDFLTKTLIDAVSINELSKRNFWSKLAFTVKNFFKRVPWYMVTFLNSAVLGGFTKILLPVSIGLLTVMSSGIENV